MERAEQNRFLLGAVMQMKFPKRRQDGSFCVDVVLSVSAEEQASLMPRITSWLDQWVKANRYWKTSLYASDEVLDFFDEFAAVPYCVAGSSNRLSIRLECRSEAKKRWKDWLVLRVLKDLQAEFKEIISVGAITDCPEERETG